MTRIEGGFPCEIRNGAEHQKGSVTNLAPDGLFVRTKKNIPHGTQVEIYIPETNGVPEMTVRAIVVRQRLVPNRSSRLKQDGVGLRILQAPDAYSALAEREMKSSEAAGSPPDPSLRRFRVRVNEQGGSVFRMLSVTASSAQAARQEIEDELGPDWQVTDVLGD